MSKVLVVGLVAALGVDAHDFKNCASTDHAHISKVTFLPDPPVHGEHVFVDVTGKSCGTLDVARVKLRLHIRERGGRRCVHLLIGAPKPEIGVGAPSMSTACGRTRSRPLGSLGPHAPRCAPSAHPIALISDTRRPDVAVTAGTVKVDVYAFGIPVPGTPSYDICTGVGIKCPLAANVAFNATVQYGVDHKVPAGISVTIKLVFEDGSKAELGCVEMDTKIGGDTTVGMVEGELAQLSPFRKLNAQVEPSALATLMKPVGRSEAEQRRLLQQAYDEQPEWSGLFGAWQAQYKKPAYGSAGEEARRFMAFKATLRRLEASRGEPNAAALADAHADKNVDELKTLAHFA